MPKGKGKGNKGKGKGKGPKQPQPGTIGAVKAAAFRGTGVKGQRRYAQSQATLQYGPQARQIRAEQRASDLQSLRLRKYFPQYLQSLKPLREQTTEVYNAAARGIASDNAALGEYAAKLQAQLGSQGAASAAARGAAFTPDTSGTQAAVARYITGNTIGAVTRSQGASQRAFNLEQKRIGKREKVDALQQEAARGRSYNQDLRNLARQRGQAASVASKEAQDSNRQFYLGLLSAQNSRRAQNISRQNAKLSSATTRRGQDISAKSSKRSARVSAANSKRTLRASLANLRQDYKLGKISHQEWKAEQARYRREFNKTHYPSGVSKGTRSHSSSSSSSGGVDPTHVQHIYAWLSSLKPKWYQGVPPAQIKNRALQESTTYTMAEVNRAYARWRKRRNRPTSGASQSTGGHRVA